ncbi:lanthionine synthetase C family protein [Spirosoma gilvum]
MHSSETTTSVEQALLNRIYQHIASQPVDNNSSLMGGQMGYALFESYYQHYTQQFDEQSRVWDRVVTSLNAIQQGNQLPTFAAGIAGVAWAFLHLCNNNLLEADDIDVNDIVADLDEPLLQLSLERLAQGDYDYLHGGLSAGLYYLERRPSQAVAHHIDAIVEKLSATAIQLPNGDITWPYYDIMRQKLSPSIEYNPSLSHGTASIVAMLSLFYARGYSRRRCSELIQGNLQWMWNNRNRSGQSVFPTTIGANREDSESRMGWCYGDLGIAHTFWLAGQKLNNKRWQAIAEQTLRQAAPRRSIADTKIADAGICHGSAGATYIFRRIAQQLHHPLLNETADYWMQRTIDYALPESDEAVYTSYFAPTNTHESNLDILDGETSVGLVLLAELGAPTTWDRFLLLS